MNNGTPKNKKGRRGTQLTFPDSSFIKPDAAFGGSLLKGNPKSKRPLSSKLPIHITLRAEKSVLRLPKTHHFVEKTIRETARKYGIRIYRIANVGNHLHLLVRLGRLGAWAPFIRELTGAIAQKLRAFGSSATRFWRFRPHTRIVAGWGKAFQVAKEYVGLNQLEGDGMISRREMKTLKDLREFLMLVQGTA